MLLLVAIAAVVEECRHAVDVEIHDGGKNDGKKKSFAPNCSLNDILKFFFLTFIFPLCPSMGIIGH